MREVLFGASRSSREGLLASAAADARQFLDLAAWMVDLHSQAREDQAEFVHGEIACLLNVSPLSAQAKLYEALQLHAQPRLVHALTHGRLGRDHARALLSEIAGLDADLAGRVVAHVLGSDTDGPLTSTPGQLRAAAKRAAIVLDAEAARARHEEARRNETGVRHRSLPDGMAQLVITAAAQDIARIRAAVRARAIAMPFDEDCDLTAGERDVAALMHALTCDRTRVEAVIECPVEQAVDAHAVAHAGAWTVGIRLPAAVALGLSDHPGVLAGYGPIGHTQLLELLPQADLLRALVDARTGEVLAADPPVRRETWQARGRPRRTGPPDTGGPPTPDQPPPSAAHPDNGAPNAVEHAHTAGDGETAAARAVDKHLAAVDPATTAAAPGHTAHPDYAAALRAALVQMATTGGRIPDLSTDRHDPGTPLRRLVELRDTTSAFPGDPTSAARSDLDHRLPHPLGRTEADNLQALSRRWHRAKHSGWSTLLLDDGTIRWTSPTGGTYDRPPTWTPPPPLPPAPED